MNNAEFIKKYGRYEFKEMSKDIAQDLALAKAGGYIGNYKISNTKKRVKFFGENCSVNVDFAMVFTLKRNELKKYIDNITKVSK